MCSPQDIPFLNPACSLRSIGSRDVDILFRITLLNILLVMDSKCDPSPIFAEACVSYQPVRNINEETATIIFRTYHAKRK